MGHTAKAHSRTLATFRLPSGEHCALAPGDIIGRSKTATLSLDDPRVSEAHAILSFRRGQLILLSLRRMIAIDGKSVSELTLEAGMIIEFAPGLYLKVAKVETPALVLGISAPGLKARVLSQVSSLYAGSPPQVVGRFEPEAPAHLWFVGDQAKLTVDGKESYPVQTGERFSVEGVEFTLLDVSVKLSGNPSTALDGSLLAPIEIIGFYDTVEIRRKQQETLHFGGLGARILSELVSVNGPVSWRGLARDIWPDDCGEVELRRKWDASLGRLRRKLRENGIRGDLIAADGSGCVRICLYEGDTARDEG